MRLPVHLQRAMAAEAEAAREARAKVNFITENNVSIRLQIVHNHNNNLDVISKSMLA